jgi:hypothetical protein
MKMMIAAAFAVMSFGAFGATANWPGSCVEGNTYSIPGEGRPGEVPPRIVVCKNGQLVDKAPTKYSCKQGSRQWLPVKGVFGPNAEEITAAATCINGRWIFDNDAYNYVPTKGNGRCKEGHVEYAVKIGPEGNPFAKDMICRNGRMVELN